MDQNTNALILNDSKGDNDCTAFTKLNFCIKQDQTIFFKDENSVLRFYNEANSKCINVICVVLNVLFLYWFEYKTVKLKSLELTPSSSLQL